MEAAMDEKKMKALAAELAKHVKTEKDLGNLSAMLTKLTVETALSAELDDHLGYEKHAPAGRNSGNSRNGKTSKKLNAIESLNSVIRKATRKRKIFPHDESALKLVYLAIQSASQRWTKPIQNWKAALNRFTIEFGDRITDHL